MNSDRQALCGKTDPSRGESCVPAHEECGSCDRTLPNQRADVPVGQGLVDKVYRPIGLLPNEIRRPE